MHTFLVVGRDRAARTTYITKLLDAAAIHPSNRILLETDDSIGIAQVRSIQKQISLKPHIGTNKAVCLLTAESLTYQAQQALLKTLEEPPAHTVLYLSAPTDELFLPTVLSRAQIMKVTTNLQSLSTEEIAEQKIFWETILQTDPLKRLALLPDLGKDRNKYIEFLDIHLAFFHLQLRNHYAIEQENTKPLQLVQIMQNLMTKRGLIAANCNPQLCLDQLFLTI